MTFLPSGELGSVYAGHVYDFSDELCEYLNGLIAAAPADSTAPKDFFVPFSSGEHVMVASPTEPMPAQDFVAAYHELDAEVDGHRIRLADHPRFFSSVPDNPELFRGVPTFVPVDALPAEVFGRVAEVRLLTGDSVIDGPVRRRFSRRGSGIDCLRNEVEDGGAIRLEATVNGDALRGSQEDGMRPPNYCMFVSPTFGEAQTTTLSLSRDNGQSETRNLPPWRRVGTDWIGATNVFEERVIMQHDGLLDASRFTLTVEFQQTGTGMLSVFAIPGFISRDAFRVY